MIKLNDRLQMIADRLQNEKTMADIGTDHGFLPVFMLQSGLCERVILADISAPSLAKAEVNCRRYFTDEFCECMEKAEFRVGDGLSVLEHGEVDAVVIAGVGGKLITEILERDMSHTCSFRKFVFQPRIGQGILRKWLCDNGFQIIHEGLVKEGNFIPEIITALSPGADSNREPGEEAEDLIRFVPKEISESKQEIEIFYRIPPWILNAEGPAEEFLQRALAREQGILEQIMLSKERNKNAEKIRCDNIYYIKDLLRQVREREVNENGKK